jgi:hypothetical protein
MHADLSSKTEPLVARLRAELETGLAKVSYFMTDDLTAMQAFVLFLVGSSGNHSRPKPSANSEIDGDLETRFDGYGLFWFWPFTLAKHCHFICLNHRSQFAHLE